MLVLPAYVLLAVGPALALYAVFIGRRPFLFLVTLASGFVWLCSLLLVSALLRPLAPLTSSLPRAALGLAAAVAAEALTLRLLWVADRTLLSNLAGSAAEVGRKVAEGGRRGGGRDGRGGGRAEAAAVAATATAPTSPAASSASVAATQEQQQQQQPPPLPHPALLRPPDTADALTTALAHGVAHGITHAALLYLSWLPVAAGGKTFYVGGDGGNSVCPRVSLFAAGACGSAAGCMVHAGASVVAFAAWDVGDAEAALRAPMLHAALSLVSLVNLVPRGGCLVGLPLALVVGVGSLLCAWESARRAVVRAGGWRGKPFVVSSPLRMFVM